MPKKACPCRTSSEVTATPAPKPPIYLQADPNTRALVIPPDTFAGAARGLLQAFKSAEDPIAQQLAGFPILELARRVAAGDALEKRLQGLEARIKHLENKSKKV